MLMLEQKQSKLAESGAQQWRIGTTGAPCKLRLIRGSGSIDGVLFAAAASSSREIIVDCRQYRRHEFEEDEHVLFDGHMFRLATAAFAGAVMLLLVHDALHHVGMLATGERTRKTERGENKTARKMSEP